MRKEEQADRTQTMNHSTIHKSTVTSYLPDMQPVGSDVLRNRKFEKMLDNDVINISREADNVPIL
jgi:hypothetical protein